MMIELICRYSKPLSEDINKQLSEHLSEQRIILGDDDFDADQEKSKFLKDLDEMFEYGPFTFSMKDVCAFNSLDEEHTAVRFYNNAVCAFKINYDQFKEIYQDVTQILIKEYIFEEDAK